LVSFVQSNEGGNCTAWPPEWGGVSGMECFIFAIDKRSGKELWRRHTGKETSLLRHLYIKCIILPRQARDKHRENSKKSGVSVGKPGGGGSVANGSYISGSWNNYVTSYDLATGAETAPLSLGLRFVRSEPILAKDMD